MDQRAKKRRAAEAALTAVEDGMVLGVGTGSTVNEFIDLLAARRPRLEAVASSSEATTGKLQAAGFDVAPLTSLGDLDLYIDGADEATRHLHLIKGGGGALTREKILAAASRRFLCIVDDTKLVGMLGAFPLPIEVIPMAQSYVARQLVRYGGRPEWREGFVTDNGNHILDVHNLSITEPVAMERELSLITGVVCVGLFAARPADVLLVATDTGVEELRHDAS